VETKFSGGDSLEPAHSWWISLRETASHSRLWAVTATQPRGIASLSTLPRIGPVCTWTCTTTTTMSSTTDPLLALRHTIKSKTPVSFSKESESCSSLLSATHILLGSTPFQKATPTRYRKPGISTPANPQDFFSLEAVYLAWLFRDAPAAEYMKQARENGLAVGFVNVTERKSVVDWLEGRIADHDKITPLVGESDCATLGGNLLRVLL
jgi:hypothetical protein